MALQSLPDGYELVDPSSSSGVLTAPGVPSGPPPGWSPGQKTNNRDRVVNFWISKGAPKQVAEGIADRVNIESGFDPRAYGDRNIGGSFGIYQHHADRMNRLMSFVNENSDRKNDLLGLENDFAWKEVQGGDPEAAKHWDEIKNAKTRTQARDLWTKYFERGTPSGGAAGGSPYWRPSVNAIASEQNRPDTDVVFMHPDEYLSLVPPLEEGPSNQTKRESLLSSLNSGDNIEAIPSLEIQPKGNQLSVQDWDGRNRAQLAADSGVEDMPVAVRGAANNPGANEITGHGGTKLPYAFAQPPKFQAQVPALTQTPIRPVPTPPSVLAPSQAVMQRTGTPTIAPPQVPPVPTNPPLKPDYYPAIAAGLNRDITSPVTNTAYRGLLPTSPSANIIPSDRIARANAYSAGQVGLNPSPNPSTVTPSISPASGADLSSPSSLLSLFNPISSASAAELQGLPPGFTIDSGMSAPPSSGGLRSLPPGYTIDPSATAPGPPPPPTLAQFDIPDLMSSLGNRVYSSLSTGLQNYLTESGESLAQIPKLIAQAAFSPGGMLSFTPPTQAQAREHLGQLAGLGEFLSMGAMNTIPTATRMLPSAGISRESQLALPFVGAPPSMINAAGARGAMQAAQVPIKLTAKALGEMNRANLGEETALAASGSPLTPSPKELMLRARTASPADADVAPGDVIRPGGLSADLLQRAAYAATPQGRARTLQDLTRRSEGIGRQGATPPQGGALDRLDRAIGQISDENAHVIRAKINQTISDSRKEIAKTEKEITEIGKEISKVDANKENLQRHLNNRISRTLSDKDPTVLDLRQSINQQEQRINQLKQEANQRNGVVIRNEADIAREQGRIDVLTAGQRFVKKDPRDIRDEFRALSPEHQKLYRTGVSDALRMAIRNKTPGNEVTALKDVQNFRERVAAIFDDPKEADRFIQNALDTETLIHGGAGALDRRVTGASLREDEPLSRGMRWMLEVATHAALSGGNPWRILQQLARVIRSATPWQMTTGRLLHGDLANEILRQYGNPNVQLSQVPGEFLRIPQMPPVPQSLLSRFLSSTGHATMPTSP